MHLTLSLQGTITTSPSKGRFVDYENVSVDWVIDFNINAEGFIQATSINIPLVTVFDDDDSTGVETPREMQLYVKPKNVKLKGSSLNLTLIPKTFRYDQENEFLTLEYF